MEFLIAFGVTFIVGSIYSMGKSANNNGLGKKPKNMAKSDLGYQQNLKNADEELITVILPTINNDK